MKRWKVGPFLVIASILLPLLAFSQDGVEMKVGDVFADRESGSPVLVLTDKEGKIALPIYIGGNEAQAILLELGRIARIRPLTHDLLYNILKVLHIKVEKVVVNDLRNDTYYATIYLLSGKERFEVDSRPSDAIALAVRAKSPIYVLPSVLEKAPVITLKREDVVEMWGMGLQDLTPELSAYFGIKDGKGVLIAYLKRRDLPFSQGDVILKIGGKRIEDIKGLRSEAGDLKRGSRTTVTLLRKGRVLQIPFSIP